MLKKGVSKMVTTRMENHSHTDMGSNLRLLDSINKVDRLIDRAVEIGLEGICITDHESLSAAMDANLYIEKIHEKQPEFKLGLGNEIYLCRDGLTSDNFNKGKDFAAFEEEK